MKKIPTLFKRNSNGRITDEVHPDALWVFNGEGTATRKFDGTCCMIHAAGSFWKRYTVRPRKKAPFNFLADGDQDPAPDGKVEGWVPVGDGPADRWHREAFERGNAIAPGTYELLGPKVQGNPEGMDCHILVFHGCEHLEDAPRMYDEFPDYFRRHDIEGIVWHHPDGRMAKIKARDFGINRKHDTPEPPRA